jgi:hypothetical protein
VEDPEAVRQLHRKFLRVFMAEKMDFQLFEVRIGTYDILTVGRHI